jgi:hypothetical protein
MTPSRKTWQEKLADKKGLPKFVKLERGFPCFNAVQKMGAEKGDVIFLVYPIEVIEFIKKVPYRGWGMFLSHLPGWMPGWCCWS